MLWAKGSLSEAKPGDIVGFSGQSWQSTVINLASYGIPRWGLAHVGVVAEHDSRLYLFESTSFSETPCDIQGAVVRGVQAHDLERRVRSAQGRVWHYPVFRPLCRFEAQRLAQWLLGRLGAGYDLEGAVRSGGLLFSLIQRLLRPEDLETLFCSELVAAAHRHIGLFLTENVSSWNPNKLARTERLYGVLLRPRRWK